MKLSDIHYDCKHFQGHIPCKPNKIEPVACPDCSHYSPISKRILIIKLGAIGDVIRTTPLLTRYRAEYPNCHITWLTLSPAVLPKEQIDRIYKPDALSLFILQNETFDIALNLDKDKEACMLLKQVDAKEKYGFTWENGHIDAATDKAEHKLLTGFFDHLSIKNTKNYLEEIFEICHFDFRNEDYLINIDKALVAKWKQIFQTENTEGKPIIGLNTGCGARWQTRLWPEQYWVDFIKRLQNAGYFPVLLGGEQEDHQNRIYHQETGAYYPGHFSLAEFIALSDSCDIIVTQVSMMMHIAIALKKELLLFNNIFNKYEFELYGRGMIVEPVSGCDCYYGNTCSRERRCMHDLSVDTVFDAAEALKEKTL
ncbi:glycosyltransferase family 9 protein [bacterium SCSIO 12741]|nr:glycosyltransferase family 9 protein [bacterium SCSIO 12741]